MGFGVDKSETALCAAGCLMQYVKDTQRTALPHIRNVRLEQPDHAVIMDAATRRNLELTQNLAGGYENTLAEVLDRTATPMGSRLLKRWIHQPIRDRVILKGRQSTIKELIEQNLYDELGNLLRQVGDVERVLARLALRSARPRDLTRLRQAFAQLPELQRLLADNEHEAVQQLAERASTFPELLDLLERAVMEVPPVLIRDGGVIRDGFNQELDELRDLANGATASLARIEEREKLLTGINTLKVGYNKVHGFYIEVSRANSHLVPAHYIRRQTLKNNERYIIDELKKYEDKVLTAQSQALALEKRLYEELLDTLLPHLGDLQDSAAALAELDVLANLAERAETLDYRCPTLIDEDQIIIEAGRHPVVEQVMTAPFIANPIRLERERRMLIITGPNMGGKSTYMRQTALIVLLAHIGAFVPADSARIGPIDRIFTRIGASDDLASGRSTFMVEMTETANILNNATARSLVLMDEIGRGTSTYDGLSLAWACAEQLASKIGAYTLFATHYFELTRLPELMSGLANVHLDAVEHGDTIAFMHAVQEGAASRSYGLQVAALAGVPKSVIQQARHKLHELESATPVAAGESRPAPVALAPQPHPVVEELEAMRRTSSPPVRHWICSIASSRCCNQRLPHKHAKGEPRGSPFYIQHPANQSGHRPHLSTGPQQTLAPLPVTLQIAGLQLDRILGKTGNHEIGRWRDHLDLAIGRGIGNEIECPVVGEIPLQHGLRQRWLGFQQGFDHPAETGRLLAIAPGLRQHHCHPPRPSPIGLYHRNGVADPAIGHGATIDAGVSCCTTGRAQVAVSTSSMLSGRTGR